MRKTIKELLLEWWAGNGTTQMPLPTIYTYDVEVDGRMIQIESLSCSRLYVHYLARKKYPDAKHISVKRQIRKYSIA
jgi:hypothetical protein